MIGDRAQDVQRQLESNSATVRVDSASQQYLEEWQNEQMNAYSVFETLMEGDGVGSSQGASTKLMKNKNRVSNLVYDFLAAEDCLLKFRAVLPMEYV